MSSTTKPKWKRKRDEDSRLVEKVLREEFPQTDAYRYNSASIRVRVVDPRFSAMSHENRDGVVEPWIEKLPERIQAHIINLLTLGPDEINDVRSKRYLLNLEFEDPSPSGL